MNLKPSTFFPAAVLGLASLLTLPCAFGADTVKANIPFRFLVGTQTMPAGAYEFRIDLDEELVSIFGVDNSATASVLIVSPLSPSLHSAADGHIIFEHSGDTYTLSQIWKPDADGVQVVPAKDTHEHHEVHSK